VFTRERTTMTRKYNVWPMLKNLQDDPRYIAFLKKIHLPTT